MNDILMQRLAKPMLLSAALIWGSSFFVMKGAVDVIPTFFLLAIRFIGGAVLLALVCWKKWKLFTLDCLWRGDGGAVTLLDRNVYNSGTSFSKCRTDLVNTVFGGYFVVAGICIWGTIFGDFLP